MRIDASVPSTAGVRPVWPYGLRTLSAGAARGESGKVTMALLPQRSPGRECSFLPLGSSIIYLYMRASVGCRHWQWGQSFGGHPRIIRGVLSHAWRRTLYPRRNSPMRTKASTPFRKLHFLQSSQSDSGFIIIGGHPQIRA